MTLLNTSNDAYNYLRNDFYFTFSIYGNFPVKKFMAINYSKVSISTRYMHEALSSDFNLDTLHTNNHTKINNIHGN
jgi:hypothetical protein